MTISYLFYDIESTGLSKAYDQVLQFAAIRTDHRLKEINRHDIKVKLRPDIIPSPLAILTNRIPMSDLANGLCEYEATRQIHRLLNEPDTISLGYNTLGFDDEFLRFSFHRNLLPPYTHQYRDGCRRMDLYPIAIIYWLYKRQVLTWPEINGKPSLKLEHLGSVNRMVTGQSHEALVDVETTIELARRFLAEKQMWQYLEGYFDKETDAHRMNELPIAFESGAGDHRKGLMISGEYGPRQNYQIPVISIGESIPYSNQTLWLRMDQPQLRETTPQSIAETTWVIRKRLGEPAILLPPHDRYWIRIGDERIALFKENLIWLQNNQEVFEQIVNYYRTYRYPFIPNLDADAALYQIGFYSRADEKLCRNFQEVSLEKKADLIDQFASPDARVLAGRILFRNYPERFQAECASEFNQYMKRINPPRQKDALVDYRDQRRTTPKDALVEIKRLKQSNEFDRNQLRLLEDLEDYIQTQFKMDTDHHGQALINFGDK
ncbi:Exodeoxyribonuclease I (EC [Olavius sp. associated proteobacterium Delta 1]|nr:Exodeoxyribonuclease I (EC [Olavius sp. associated proteobacterium Delta 1]